MEHSTLMVLPDRKCGTVKEGGLYLVGRMSDIGTLLPFTAIAAPFEARIAHPRNYQIVDVPATLLGADGLKFDGDAEFAGLPKRGIADLWGMSAGYKYVWDVIQETMDKGVSRRVANVPDIPRPFPVLMMHMHAVLDIPMPDKMLEWLQKRMDIEEPRVPLSDRPWQEAQSLGHVRDDDYLWHPYIALYEAVVSLDDDELLDWFLEENQIELRQGVFGLSWISDACYILRPDETEVPDRLAEKGVVAAVSEHDPRARVLGES